MLRRRERPMSDPNDRCGLTLSTGDGRPYVAQIHDQLLARIRSRELPTDARLPSLRRMAAACGVSLGIVKQAVNTLCIEGHLRSHPGRGIFVAEQAEKRRMVTLVLPALDDYEMPRIIRGVKAGLAGTGRRLLIQAADYDFGQEVDLLHAIDPAIIGGALIFPPPLSALAAPLRELSQRMPVVLVETVLPGVDIDGVETDHAAIGRTAFSMLVARGHRRIAVVDHTGDSLSDRELRAGADEALAEAGLCFAELPRITTDVTDLNPVEPWANGEKAASALLRDHPGLTAVVGVNNYLTLGAWRALRNVGKRVPAEVSLVSIGDLHAFSSIEPPVTTVGHPYEELGRRAAQRLVARLEGTAEQVRIERLPPVVSERASVGAAPA
jgi:DNA-binding LacI/PurR family transcriptional regulator